MLALQGLGDPPGPYNSWSCDNCGNLTDPNNQALCQAQCGTNVVSPDQQNVANVVTSLPGGTSVSSVPGVLEPQGTSTVTAATNWWRVGLAAVLGLGAAWAIYRSMQRSM